jgi:hypothetical protein
MTSVPWTPPPGPHPRRADCADQYGIGPESGYDKFQREQQCRGERVPQAGPQTVTSRGGRDRPGDLGRFRRPAVDGVGGRAPGRLLPADHVFQHHPGHRLDARVRRGAQSPPPLTTGMKTQRPLRLAHGHAVFVPPRSRPSTASQSGHGRTFHGGMPLCQGLKSLCSGPVPHLRKMPLPNFVRTVS